MRVIVVPKSGSSTDWRYPGFASGDGRTRFVPPTIVHAADATVTATVALAVLPSTVAEIAEIPAATPTATPLAPTVATVGFEDVHDTARPVMTPLLGSYAVTVNASVAPTAIDAVGGAMSRWS